MATRVFLKCTLCINKIIKPKFSIGYNNTKTSLTKQKNVISKDFNMIFNCF